MLLLASCGPPETQDTDPAVEPDDQEPDDDVEPQEDGTPDPDEGGADEDEGIDEEQSADDGVERLAGDPTSDRGEREGEPGEDLRVVGVRVGTHDGFDRVVFELAGDGVSGWRVEFVDEPIAQGSGAPIEVAGTTTLVVALRPLPYPQDGELSAPDRVAAPDGALTLTEVVQDTLFEGQHRFILGLDVPTAYIVDRLEDPQRVVVDLVPEG